MTSIVSLPVEKYSFTDKQPPTNWQHDENPGLVLNYCAPHLKVMRGKKELDSFDLVQKAQQAKEIISAAEGCGESPQMNQLPISAMVRPNGTVLAIRYSRSTRTARFMQLRFRSFSDSQIARRLLELAGVRIDEKRNLPGRPSASDAQDRSSSRQGISSRPSNATLDVAGHSSTLRPTTLAGSDYPSSPPGVRRLALQNTLFNISKHQHNSDNHQAKEYFTEAPEELDWRPSTAPAFVSEEGIGAMLPPRRELPFARPISRGLDKTDKPSFGVIDTYTASNMAASSRERPSTANLPPLQPPTYAATRSMSTRTNTMSKTKLPLSQGTDLLSSQYLTAASGLSSESMSTGSQANRGPGSSALKRPLSAVTNITEDVRQRQRPYKATSPNATPHQEYRQNDLLINLVRDAAQSASSRNLQSYAMQPQTTRDNLMNEFFVECIEDDGFIRLCQDVAASWRRIGLGLQ